MKLHIYISILVFAVLVMVGCASPQQVCAQKGAIHISEAENVTDVLNLSQAWSCNNACANATYAKAAWIDDDGCVVDEDVCLCKENTTEQPYVASCETENNGYLGCLRICNPKPNGLCWYDCSEICDYSVKVPEIAPEIINAYCVGEPYPAEEEGCAYCKTASGYMAKICLYTDSPTPKKYRIGGS